MEILLVRSKVTKGVLLVFHGCMRRPTDWWHYDSACVTCIGKITSPAPALPESCGCRSQG
jgi:hypothetical protein